MRNSIVDNKYNLTLPIIKKLKVVDRSQLKSPLFWRNDVIKAWCISGNAGSAADQRYGTDNSFWIGIYDENAPSYAGRFRVYLTSYGGMCGYTFHHFFCPDDIRCENDILIQERFLQKINLLLDIGVLKMD